jgi:hypothetical protein
VSVSLSLGRKRTAAFACEACNRAIRVPIDRPRRSVTCEGCGREHPIQIDEAVLASEDLARCLVCGLDRLYVQKDFNKWLGVAIFAVAALLSVPTWGLSLVAATVLDLGLYHLLGDVTLCYRCAVQYRGFRRNPEHQPFDLHVAEAIDNEPRAL